MDIHLELTSPRMQGSKVTKAQRLLTKNRHGQDYDPGSVDGVYGIRTAAAARRAKYRLGYPRARLNTRFGPQLYAYLIPLSDPDAERVPLAYRTRATIRARILERRRRRAFRAAAVRIAESQVGTSESPPGSNRVKYSAWYGLVGPWCAMFASWCFTQAGRPMRYASVDAIYEDAANNRNGLDLVATPELGDLCLIGSEHMGIFISESGGMVTYVSGNTGSLSEPDGGTVAVHTLSRTIFTSYVRVHR